MRKHQKRQRFIATFFLLIFFPTLVPINLFASNNGPTAPEATSFEPVDAKDMVNLLSGDMSYVLPLLNVPSPEGGYPISIANHSGIAIDQEASWLGLGWNLNPGAINRSVSGVPDDWYRTILSNIYYDAGGETTTYFGSIGVGFSEGLYSVGLYGSYTENKSFGGTTEYSSSFGAYGGALGFGSSIGTNGASLSYGFGMGYDNNYSGSISLNQNFNDGSTSVSLSLSGSSDDSIVPYNSSIGFSLDAKNGFLGSMSGSNISLGSGNAIGRMSYLESGFTIPIQIFNVNVSFGFKKMKYWAYEHRTQKYNGLLYSGDLIDFENTINIQNRVSSDSYNSLYKLDAENQMDEDNLSYMAYDNYSVSGQGISGTFTPGIYEPGTMLDRFKSYKTNSFEVEYLIPQNGNFTKKINDNDNDIHFYFDNENSSFLKVPSTNWPLVYSPSTIPNQINAPNNKIDPAYLSDFNAKTKSTIDGVTHSGYNISNKRKRTGSFIEVFTNEEILANPSKIIQPENFDRTTDSTTLKGIGAFKITALDGKTYHYSIPVYQKELVSKNTDLESNFNDRYSMNLQFSPYATHWLLTAITGPDYIDLDNNNIVGIEDYGYWVSFDYGKWSDGFPWKTPVKVNDKSKFFEWGVKEIYYLDKIKTRTHTALFVKETRTDDISYSLQVGNNYNDLSWNQSRSLPYYYSTKNNKRYFAGIFNEEIEKRDVSGCSYIYHHAIGEYGQYIKFNTHRSLKLKKILLLKNDSLNGLSKTSTTHPSTNFNGQIRLKERIFTYCTSSTNGHPWDDDREVYARTWGGEFFNNIIDASDISTNLEESAIKTINFNHSYKLADDSSNSASGRLTLESIDLLGKDGQETLPPYKFDYINTGNYSELMEDNWGFYKNKPDQWSLNKISLPTGAEINIDYESDDFDKESVKSKRVIDADLQFQLSRENDNLIINVQNENNVNNINFTEFFQNGIAYIDFWADYSRLNGLIPNKASVDILSNVEVVSVSPTNLVLSTNYDQHTNTTNNGYQELFNHTIGIENHPGFEFQKKKRGVHTAIESNGQLSLLYQLKSNKTQLATSQKQGGGIRVKEISIIENSIKKSITKYFYNLPGFDENKSDINYKSSGITSYVPQKYFVEVKYKSELPPPSVMYEYVTVKSFSSTGQLETKNQYNFEVLKEDSAVSENELILDGILEITKPQSVSSISTYNIDFSRYSIKDLTSKIGRLKNIKTFNNNGQLLSSKQFNFKNYNDIKQGISEESFNIYKKITEVNSDIQVVNTKYKLSTTSKIKYPSILESEISSRDSYSNIINYNKYDFLTGQVIETSTTSSDGKLSKTKVVPAYTKYPEMGSKVDDINNRNMLSQTAVEYSYLKDAAGNDRVTGVGITTWSNIWNYKDIAGVTTTPTLNKEKIWRKHKTYVWNGVVDSEGFFPTTYNSATDDGFDWTGVGIMPSQWKQTSGVTLYDHFSAPLEVKDMNNNLASTKMGDKNTKVMASGNAGYNEMYYSGGENIDIIDTTTWLEPEVKGVGITRDITKAHTGKYSIATTSTSQFGVDMKENQHRKGKYKLSVWVHKDNANKARFKTSSSATAVVFNGETVTAGDWVLKTHYFDVDSSYINPMVCSSDGTVVYFDDLMVRPVASSITGYVYNEFDELTYIIGNNGLATKFEYDNAGRLIKTFAEIVDDPANAIIGGFKLKSTNKINYRTLN